MKIDYISDLHVDKYINEKENESLFHENYSLIDYIIFNGNTIEYGDYLIIAGDISENINQIKFVISFYEKRYKKVLFCLGNHDFYSFNGDTIFDKFEKINSFNGNTIEIEGLKIGGLPMFYDFSYGEKLGLTKFEMNKLWLQSLIDPYKIKDGKTYIRYLNKRKEERVQTFDPLSLFEEQYEKLNKLNKCDLIFSHVMPFVPRKYSNKYKQDPLTGCFSFDGSSFIKKAKVKFWIAGHTHEEVDTKEKGIRLLINPFGYPHERGNKRIKSLIL